MSQKFLSDIEVKAGLRDSSGTLGTSGQILSSTGSNVSWINQSTVASDVQNQVKAGVAITKGQAVYVTGADGTNIIVGLASNTSEATSSKTLGLLDATVATNGFANVVQIGRLSGLNTSGATAGDPVWLGVNGNLIYGLANKPYAPAHLVFIGIVTRVNSNNGEIFINVQNGFELKEIHDVDIVTNVPINGDVLGYDGTLWVNKTIAEWLGYTPANASGTINYVSKFTGSTTLGNSQLFDNGTFVGIGTSSPTNKLQVVTSGTALASFTGAEYSQFNIIGGSQNFYIQNYNNVSLLGTKGDSPLLFTTYETERMRIASNGNVGIGTTTTSITGTPFRTMISSSDTRVMAFNGVDFSSVWWNGSGTPQFAIDSISGGGAAFWVNNGSWAERMRINSAGNVGIGTTAPIGRFTVVGSAGSAGLLDFNTDATRCDIQSYNKPLAINRQGNNTLLNEGGGNVGIGTTSPISTLQSAGNLTVGPGSAANLIGTMQLLTGGASPINNRITYGTDGTGWKFAIGKNQGGTVTDQFVIQDNGNIGIGTTAPGGKLHVVGTSPSIFVDTSNTFALSVGAASATPNIVAIGTSGTGVPQIQGYTNGFAATTNLAIQPNGGNLGIGTTSPGARLDVVGVFDALPARILRQATYGEILRIGRNGVSETASINYPADGVFAINTAGSERMRIASNGNVGIGTTSPTYKTHIEGTGADIFLTKNTTSTSFNRSFFYNNNNVGIQFLNFGSAYASGTEFSVGVNGSVIQSNTTSAFAVGTSGAYPLILGTSGTERMRILSGGNVGIGTTSPAYKTDIVGNLRFSTGYLNSDNCFERVFSDAIVFANGTANLAADVILGNSNFWGYIEVEVTSTFNNQSSPGKLTKIFAAGVTPNNNIYANESRVSDAMGPVPNNVAIGDLSWDATNSRYRIPISHIVSTGNTYTVKVRMFTANASSSTGAKGVFDSISIGSTYTLTALSRQYPYYNSKLSIGTSSASAVLTLQNESGAYGTSYPFKMLSYAGTNIFRSYMDGNWNYVNEVFQIGGNSCGYIISTNSSERMRITSTGNVGIGTSSPGAKLHVNGNVISTGMGPGGTAGTYEIGDSSTYMWGNSSDAFIAFNISYNEQLRIDGANGNVGIGTTTPDPSAILDLSSTTKGFLPPRLSSGDIAAISTPTPGLMVYNTTTEEINVYTLSGGWRILRYI
jgi:hypothetical protein